MFLLKLERSVNGTEQNRDAVVEREDGGPLVDDQVHAVKHEVTDRVERIHERESAHEGGRDDADHRPGEALPGEQARLPRVLPVRDLVLAQHLVRGNDVEEEEEDVGRQVPNGDRDSEEADVVLFRRGDLLPEQERDEDEAHEDPDKYEVAQNSRRPRLELDVVRKLLQVVLPHPQEQVAAHRLDELQKVNGAVQHLEVVEQVRQVVFTAVRSQQAVSQTAHDDREKGTGGCQDDEHFQVGTAALPEQPDAVNDEADEEPGGKDEQGRVDVGVDVPFFNAEYEYRIIGLQC